MLVALYCCGFCSDNPAALIAHIPDQAVDFPGLKRIRRRSTVGFEGLYDTGNDQERAESTIASGTVRSVRSVRSATTSIVDDDLEHYRGRLGQRREELLSFLSRSEEESSLYCSVAYYEAQGKFYAQLYDDIRSISESLMREHQQMQDIKIEVENHKIWKFWGKGPNDLARQKLKVDTLLSQLEGLLKPNQCKKEYVEFSPVVKAFLENETSLDDLDSMNAKEVLSQIQEINRIIRDVNKTVLTLQVPYKKFVEKEKWIVSELERIKSKGIRVNLPDMFFAWSDDGGYRDLQCLEPIAIEAMT